MRFPRFIALLAVLLLAASAAYSADPAVEALNKIGKALQQPVGEWRYIGTDVPGAEKTDFDDSGWKVGKAEFEYGSGPVGWARQTIVIPEKIGGLSTAGSRAVLKLSADDDGVVFVNGKKIHDFHWDEGHAVLTENAKPGESFLVAVKILNNAGPGRLMAASLEFGGSTAESARRLAQDIKICEAMLASKMWPMDSSYSDALARCKQDINAEAAENGDAAALMTSLDKASLELKPFGEKAHQYTCNLIGHAHIDMNWLWLWPETVQVCQNTFATMCNFLEEYPDFKFSQSQASTYVAVQNTKPETFAKMKKYVKEGRWEITGGTWVENDLNMSSGESIAREMLYARQYFRENFGKVSDVCWMPDTFGHPWTIPQIVKKAGMKYYFFMRCGVDKPVFWWQAPDGSRILALNRAYSAGIDDSRPLDTINMSQRLGIKNDPFVYGVGDHGGGPTRGWVEKAIDLNKQAVSPNMKFSTVGEFFDSALKQKTDYPTHDGELQFEFRGCYTSHGDIKKMNRQSENMLPAAEAVSTIANQLGRPYPMEGFRESWRRTCFNQFHDILCGTAIHGSYPYSRGLFDKSEKQWSTAISGSLQQIAGKVNTRGQGVPIVVFNPLSWTRTDLVETQCPFAEKDGKFYVVDAKGRKLPAQRIGNSISFVARDVPSLGYSTYWLRRGAKPENQAVCRASSTPESCTIENEFLKVTVNRQTGTISSIYDKKAGREVIKAGESGDVLQALSEAPTGMSAWELGKITATENIEKARSVEVLQTGPVVSSVRVDLPYKTSLFAQDIKLYAGVPRLDIKMTADWQEVGTPEKGCTMLKTAFAVNVENGKATFEIPYGAIERKATGEEYPSQKWMDLSNGSYGVSLMNDCKYGADAKDNTVRLTLLRSSYDPDPRPDVGIHTITYSLYPHVGDWRKAGTVRRSYELNNPLIASATKAHKGTLQAERSFVSVSPANLVVTGFKKAEDNSGMILRFYETSGAPTTAKIRVNGAKTWSEVSLVEEGNAKGKPIGGDGFAVPVGKWEIKTLLLK
jgi:alpha-mannosidase